MNKNSVSINFTSADPRNFADLNNRKKNKIEVTKEGVVVNTFIKDPDTYYNDLQVNETALPKDMFENKDKISGKFLNNPTVPLVAVPLALLGVAAGLSMAYKHSFVNKYKTSDKLRIPPQGRLVALNNDNAMSLLMLVQDPTWKNLHVATAVIAASATAFVLKNIVDGVKEVCVKKKAADIKRDKEEKLIDIETRSFAGKNQIIRSLMSQKAQEMNNLEKDKISFGANDNANSDEKKSSNKAVLYTVMGVGAVALTALFTKSIFKNLGSIAKEVSEKAAEASKNLKSDFKKLKNNEQLEKELSLSKISDGAKDFVREEWNNVHSPSRLAAAPDLMTGEKGKTGFTSVVFSESSAFIYTWLINKTPQTKTLATVMCSSAAIGYVGEKTVEGVKEIQVEKANAKTEVDLQDRLVQVELKNFYQKKNSYIQPLMNDYKEKIKSTFSKQEVKKLKENVLTEIKNGPPFVYS